MQIPIRSLYFDHLFQVEFNTKQYDEFLAIIGMSRAAFLQERVHILPLDRYCSVYRYLNSISQDEPLPIKMTRNLRVNDLGMIGITASTSGTLGDALNLLLRLLKKCLRRFS